ncbi:hypothetical protein G352_01107 [Rhodococcus ruber BKS 20-38]|uniref:Tautomerase n=1 Tax=Rhodococcus ruber BKS 20-38 TaxID=1278076 RepID=M2Y2F5_9NOCA|nr:tautomerase family protein [Rhodococcus ruber]EME67266.1 hypothetical protein G352_01107 [Rhodococcus ruber BKS 20-38]
MPLIRVDLLEGRTPEQITRLLDAVHGAVVDAFEVPVRDRYQLVHTHPPHEMVVLDTGLGFERSQDMVVVQVFSRTRPEEQKLRFHRLLVERFERDCGMRSEDVMITITENGDSDWSFGQGEAQFHTGILR